MCIQKRANADIPADGDDCVVSGVSFFACLEEWVEEGPDVGNGLRMWGVVGKWKTRRMECAMNGPSEKDWVASLSGVESFASGEHRSHTQMEARVVYATTESDCTQSNANIEFVVVGWDETCKCRESAEQAKQKKKYILRVIVSNHVERVVPLPVLSVEGVQL
jgi:hypothetical protein